jgi:hypothetical protein
MARGRAKDKAKDEADAAADAAAGGVSGTAGAVTEEAQKFAHAAGDAVSSVAGTVADSAKGAVSAVTSAVSGAVEKARAYPAKGSPSGEGAARGSPSHDAARTPDRNEANARKTFRTLPSFFFSSRQARQQPSSRSINPPTNPPHPLTRKPQGAEALDVNKDGKVDAADASAATEALRKRCAPAKCVVM